MLETDCPTVKPGAERNWYIDLDKDAAANNLKDFGMAAGEALTGAPMADEEVDGAGLLELCTPEQPLLGFVLRTKTWNKPTKKGDDFTRHLWYGVNKEEFARAKASAEKLGIEVKAA